MTPSAPDKELRVPFFRKVMLHLLKKHRQTQTTLRSNNKSFKKGLETGLSILS